MDVVPSLVGASDESCADISTGPSTPDSSPLFGPSLSGEIVAKQFTPSLNEVNRLQLDTFDAETEILSTAPSAASHLVRNVCFIGAGYVGTCASSHVWCCRHAHHETVPIRVRT